MRRGILIVALTLILLSGIYFSLASAVDYNYEVKQITDSKINEPWTFQAITDDPNVVQVTFHYWFPGNAPGNSEVDTKVVTGTYLNPFIATIIPDKEGVWEVHIDFQYTDGTTHGTVTHYETITEFGPPPNVVPEVPILGTVGVAVAMLLGFAVYKRRKR